MESVWYAVLYVEPSPLYGRMRPCMARVCQTRANQNIANVSNEAKLMMPINTMVDLCISTEKRDVGISTLRLKVLNLPNFEIEEFLSARENINFSEL